MTLTCAEHFSSMLNKSLEFLMCILALCFVIFTAACTAILDARVYVDLCVNTERALEYKAEARTNL